MFSYVLAIFLIYILYRFVVGLVLPIAKASRNMQEKMRAMNENLQGEHPKPGAEHMPKRPFNTGENVHSKPSTQDYLDFEEIK